MVGIETGSLPRSKPNRSRRTLVIGRKIGLCMPARTKVFSVTVRDEFIMGAATSKENLWAIPVTVDKIRQYLPDHPC